MQIYTFFRIWEFFFRERGCAWGCAGVRVGGRPRVGGVRGKAGGGARPAQGRRHRGAEGRTRAGHHSTAAKRRGEDGRARRPAQAAGTPTAEGRAPPPACGAWVRAPCGGLRVGMFHVEHSCNGLIFSTLRLTKIASAAANVPKLPQQFFAGVGLRGYRCKHVVTDVNTGGYRCTRRPRTAGAGGRRHQGTKAPRAARTRETAPRRGGTRARRPPQHRGEAAGRGRPSTAARTSRGDGDRGGPPAGPCAGPAAARPPPLAAHGNFTFTSPKGRVALRWGRR